MTDSSKDAYIMWVIDRLELDISVDLRRQSDELQPRIQREASTSRRMNTACRPLLRTVHYTPCDAQMAINGWFWRSKRTTMRTLEALRKIGNQAS